MLTFRLMDLEEFYSQVHELSAAHFQEASSYNGELDLDMDWGAYARYYNAGVLKVVSAWHGKEFVGYAFVIKVPVLLHKSVSMGMVQFIYLKPEYRKGRNGLKLIRYAENVAKALDCTYVTFSISKKQKRVHNLFVDLGYKLREAVFSKRL